MSKTAVVL